MTDQEPKSRAVNRDIADLTPLAPIGSPMAFMPDNMGQIMEFAKMMAGGKFAVPKHLRSEPGMCVSVTLTAARAALDPFMLANETQVIYRKKGRDGPIDPDSGILGYSAKAIHAIVMQSGRFRDRFQLEFTGEGEELICRIKGHLKGASQPASEIYKLKDITTRNSPLWKTQPRQQLGYFSERAWCRLHAPDAMMGLKTPDDAAWSQTIDVTPGVSETMAAVAKKLGFSDRGNLIEPRDPGDPDPSAPEWDAKMEESEAAAPLPPEERGDEELRKIQEDQKEQRDLLGGES